MNAAVRPRLQLPPVCPVRRPQPVSWCNTRDRLELPRGRAIDIKPNEHRPSSENANSYPWYTSTLIDLKRRPQLNGTAPDFLTTHNRSVEVILPNFTQLCPTDPYSPTLAGAQMTTVKYDSNQG